MAPITDFTPPPEDGATGDVMQAHAKVWPYLQAPVELCARELTKDRFKRRELIQEGRLELWRIDATRCDVTSGKSLRYLRMRLINHIRTVAKSRELTMADASDRVPEDLVKMLSR